MDITVMRQAFEALPDEALIKQVREQDDYALDFLMNKYKSLVERKARSYFLMGASKEDIIQEGMIGLFKAIRDYREDKDASFYSFADLCITRQMITAVKAATRQKHMPLNQYVSLDQSAFEESSDNMALIERMPSKKVVDPEAVLIGEESRNTIEKAIRQALSGFERQVLEYYLEERNYVEIAKILDKSPKSIDNALQRIKKKVLKVIK